MMQRGAPPGKEPNAVDRPQKVAPGTSTGHDTPLVRLVNAAVKPKLWVTPVSPILAVESRAAEALTEQSGKILRRRKGAL